MAGLMDFLMDALFVIEDPDIIKSILEKLKVLSNNLQLFYYHDESLFFGEQLFKLSADLTAGTSGIILTLDRYRKLSEEGCLYPSDMFYLDQECNVLKERSMNETTLETF